MKRQEESGTQVQIIEPLAVLIPEACRMIGIGRSKLYELIADGTIEIKRLVALPAYLYRS